MKIRLTATVSILIVLFTLMGITSPVFAGAHKPEMFVFSGEGWSVLPPGENGNPCSFAIVNHQSGTFRRLTWYDADGKWTEFIELYGNQKADWSANGKSVQLNIQGPMKFTAEYLPDRNMVTMVSMGTTNMFLIPGYGVVMGGAGRSVWTWTWSTDWQTLLGLTIDSQTGLSATDADRLCSYLAP